MKASNIESDYFRVRRWACQNFMNRADDIRVIAFDPSSRGLGFAVLEGPNRLIDWGVKETKIDKKRKALKLVEHFIENYQPDVIVMEDYVAKGSRRCRRVQALLADISTLAAKKKVKAKRISRLKVKQAFPESGASNKYDIAVAIANRFPELAPRIPRFRKAWMSEDYRMSIFDAVALATSLLDSENKVYDARRMRTIFKSTQN